MPLLPGGDADLQQAIFQALSAGTLRLVGADDLDRAVTRPGDIGVGQSGLRLAKPKPAESPPGATGAAGAGGAATGTSGGTAGTGTGATRGGMAGTATGTDSSGPHVSEQELTFSLMSSLTDEAKREAVRLLLRDLTNAVDEGKLSYAQLMLKVIVDSGTADVISEEARQAGANPTVRDV